MTITGIDTVAVVVSDRKKAIQWYRDVLGLPVAYIGPFESDTDQSIQGSPDKPGLGLNGSNRHPQRKLPDYVYDPLIT